MSESDKSSRAAATQPAQPSSAPAAKRNWFARYWFISLLVLLVGSCAFFTRDRTVSWAEEVPLNTGETIWVKRYVTYKLQGAGGNPMDIGYSPDWTEEITFEWKGKKYRYVGGADLMLLAISPLTQRPVLVAKASNKQWHWKHNYRCTTPHYVQFVPSADGQSWSWPPNVEPWLYGMSHNLMRSRDDVQKMKSRYTANDRHISDRSWAEDPTAASNARIDPNYKSETCRK